MVGLFLAAAAVTAAAVPPALVLGGRSGRHGAAPRLNDAGMLAGDGTSDTSLIL